jgi:MarR family transcriptional regulator, lower aerobic nicotinate degradation pathway regulator
MNATTATAAPRVRPPSLPKELVGSATFLLKRLGYAAKEQAMEAYDQVGLHPYHHAVLIALREGPHDTQGAIADELGYDRGQLVGLLDELEERGLVERRRQLVRITAQGKRMLSSLRALARRVEADFLAPLSEEERAELHSLLVRLAEKHEPRCAPMVPGEQA